MKDRRWLPLFLLLAALLALAGCETAAVTTPRPPTDEEQLRSAHAVFAVAQMRRDVAGAEAWLTPDFRFMAAERAPPENRATYLARLRALAPAAGAPAPVYDFIGVYDAIGRMIVRVEGRREQLDWRKTDAGWRITRLEWLP